MITGSRLSPDAERELRDLRARAYGPNPDIASDPAAFARLSELEAARVAVRPSVTDAAPPAAVSESVLAAAATATDAAADAVPTRPAAPTAVLIDDGVGTAHRSFAPGSLWQEATSTRSRRQGVAAGAVVLAVALISTVVWAVTPHPDATLEAAVDESTAQLARLLPFAGQLEIDVSSLRAYESYRGVQPWSGVDAWGSPCLFLLERSSDNLLAAECMPREAPLLADIGAWPYRGGDFAKGLANGSIIRFHLAGDSVEVYLHFAPAED